MKAYREIEVKYRLLNGKEVIGNLRRLSMRHLVVDERQKDTYYMPCHRNFLEHEIVSEWLRIRETNHGCSINYKQWLPVGAKIQSHCNEYESEISDPLALKLMLKSLDFQSLIVVEKIRNSWIHGKFEISIDEVIDLGTFIEVESKCDLDEVPDENFEQVLELIGARVGPRDRRGYPYQMLEKMRGRRNVF